MANTVDLYKKRTMLEVLRQMLPARTFLLETFFPAAPPSSTESVDIDIIKGKRRLAPFVSPEMEGTQVERIGYTTRTYKPPYVKPKMVSTAADFLNRMAGETIYEGGDTPAARAARQLGLDLAELDEMITRREEWMAAQALQTGKITVSGDGVSETIDFGMNANHLITLAGTAKWSDTTNSTPLEDLRTWRRLIQKDSGLTPNVVVMGTDALDQFLKNDSVTDQLDTRRIDLGMVDPSTFPNGAIYYGRIKDVGCDLWVYDEWYYDGSSNTALINAKKVIMGATQAYCRRHFGAIRDLEALAAVARFPKSWVQDDPSVRYLMLQSAPLVALHQVDAFVCATVDS